MNFWGFGAGCGFWCRDGRDAEGDVWIWETVCRGSAAEERFMCLVVKNWRMADHQVYVFRLNNVCMTGVLQGITSNISRRMETRHNHRCDVPLDNLTRIDQPDASIARYSPTAGHTHIGSTDSTRSESILLVPRQDSEPFPQTAIHHGEALLPLPSVTISLSSHILSIIHARNVENIALVSHHPPHSEPASQPAGRQAAAEVGLIPLAKSPPSPLLGTGQLFVRTVKCTAGSYGASFGYLQRAKGGWGRIV